MAHDLIHSLREGDRRALARAMTLVESTREDHRREADALLSQLDPVGQPSLRLGISGSPGVGKSTFIEAFGNYLIEQGHKVAVLAIDPTSPLTQGSILADKTRMPKLSSSPNAFIRPSPSAGTLGGVAAKTRETVCLCEAAGFDVILIETVGVGQSEIAVSNLSDMVLLLLPPAGGDELQGIKKGIVEIADLILVNKCDGDLQHSVNQAVSHYRQAVALANGRQWLPPVEAISAKENQGMETVWGHVEDYKNHRQSHGMWNEHRQKQTLSWFDDAMKEEVWRHFEMVHGEEFDSLKGKLKSHGASPVAVVHEFVHGKFFGN